MTPELARAGHHGTPPFHGDTCEVTGLSLDQLWRCYKAAASLVTKASSHTEYRSAQDWHLHDGFITESKELSAADWTAWCDSPQSLLNAWEAEDWCHRTVYPLDLAWCLRFRCWEQIGSDQYHGFELDLTGDSSMVKEFADAVKKLYEVELQVTASSDWFIESGRTNL